MGVFQTEHGQVGTFFGGQVVQNLEDSLQLFFVVFQVSAQGVRVAAANAVIGIHVVDVADLVVQGAGDDPLRVGVNRSDVVLGVLLSHAGPGDAVQANLASDGVVGTSGGHDVGIHQAFVNELLGPGQSIHSARRQQGVGDLAVALNEVVIESEVEAHTDHVEAADAAAAGDAVGVINAVAVGVILRESLGNFIQGVDVGGNSQAQVVQPVLTDEQTPLRLGARTGTGGVHAGQGVQGTVHQVGSAVGVGQEVENGLQLVVDVGIQVQQDFFFHVVILMVRVDEEHIGDGVTGDTVAHGSPVIVDQNDLPRNTGLFQDLLVYKVFFQGGRPAIAQSLSADDDFNRFVSHGGDEGQSHHRNEEQRNELLHFGVSFS